ncbi:MAG: hypothetical protein CMD29_04550 [Flavobacteriales bacterium]|nr:hypothetical protein [Flavobacteriales bacterium]
MKSLNILIKGIFMGIADLVPGISGGTIALIFGVYNELITSLSKLSFKSVIKLKNNGLIPFWNYINGKFLFLLFSGIILGILFFTYLIDWLIMYYSIYLWAFFSGLVLSSTYMIYKRIKSPDYNLLIYFIFGIIISSILGQLNHNNSYFDYGYTYLFFSAFIAITAMILPGISGAYILILFGTYSEIISLIKNLILIMIEQDFSNAQSVFTELLIFGFGIISGLLIFSKFIKWLLSNYYDKTLTFMIGLMIGGIKKIWPWQENGEMVFPNNHIGDSNILTVIFYFILGGLFLLGLNFLEKNLTDEKEKNFK